MKKGIYFSILFFFLLFTGCGENQHTAEAEKEPSADAAIEPSTYVDEAIGEFTYEQIVSQVFGETGQGVQWNGRSLPEDGRPFLSMSMGQQCGVGGCGKQVFVTNAHESMTVRTTVTIPYQVKGRPGYLAREYAIGPGQKQLIGCSHICEGGEQYEFRRAIVGAELMSEQLQ